jgi:galactitol-specific phosphotransferase system IIC component
VAVSAGVSIPFVLMAFNLEVVLDWSNQVIARAKHSKLAVGMISLVTLVVFISLAIILSQPLETGIQAGVLIAVGLLSSMAVISLFMFHMFKSKGWFE